MSNLGQNDEDLPQNENVSKNINVPEIESPAENKNSAISDKKNPKWLSLQEHARKKALQFMKDPDLDHLAQEYITDSLSENTLRAYASDVKIFRRWCELRDFEPLPATPNVVANFLAAQAAQVNPVYKARTIERRLAAIAYVHRMGAFDVLPTDALLVRQTLMGIKRKKLVAPHKKEPATHDLIQKMADRTDPSTLTGIRDRALLLMGFAGAFRRSELVGVLIEDIKVSAEGMVILIRKSKTDQTGEGMTKAIIRGTTHCPVAAVQAWLTATGLNEGFLFRRFTKSGTLWPSRDHPAQPDLTPQSVSLIVKKYAALIGLNSNEFAGHSLRHGFPTSAIQNGASLEKVMMVTGHKDPKSTMGYFKDVKKFENHAGMGLL